MDGIETAHVAAVLGALGVVLLVAVPRRAAVVAGLALLAGAEGALLGALAVGDRILAPAALALGFFAAAVFAAGAVALVRRPELVTPLVLVAAPFRLPLDFGREHDLFVAVAEPGELGRLLPLYLVLGAAALALVWRLVRGAPYRPLPRELAWPLAAFLAFASLSLLWTDDLRAGENLLAYFLLPFAVLVAVVTAAPFPAWMPRALAWIAVSLGLLFALVGLWQQATGRLLFYAPNLEVSNSYASYFRVTSLFRDPSLFGRHLVLAIAVLVVCVWLRRVHIAAAAAAAAVLWLGLFYTYSQSSFVALIVVVLAIAAAAGRRAMRVAVAGAAVAALLVGAGFVAAAVRDESAQRATSDRSRRVEVTLDVVADRPLAGVGLGAQPRASQQRAERPGPVPNYVSHTTPLTVAAELGVVGVVLYALVLAAAVWLVEHVRRRDVALGLTLGAVLLALFVHSLFYSGFFEDPITWLALAVGASFLAARGATEEGARLPA
jgi:putative inorganic carbon (HCO3(-)) transporter